jgi:hypothetical protein
VLLTGDIELFIDGTSTGSPAIPVNTFAGTAAFTLGSSGIAAYANIDVARCLVYNRDLPTNERDLVTEYLQGAYGL